MLIHWNLGMKTSKIPLHHSCSSLCQIQVKNIYWLFMWHDWSRKFYQKWVSAIHFFKKAKWIYLIEMILWDNSNVNITKVLLDDWNYKPVPPHSARTSLLRDSIFCLAKQGRQYVPVKIPHSHYALDLLKILNRSWN